MASQRTHDDQSKGKSKQRSTERIEEIIENLWKMPLLIIIDISSPDLKLQSPDQCLLQNKAEDDQNRPEEEWILDFSEEFRSYCRTEVLIDTPTFPFKVHHTKDNADLVRAYSAPGGRVDMVSIVTTPNFNDRNLVNLWKHEDTSHVTK